MSPTFSYPWTSILESLLPAPFLGLRRLCLAPSLSPQVSRLALSHTVMLLHWSRLRLVVAEEDEFTILRALVSIPGWGRARSRLFGSALGSSCVGCSDSSKVLAAYLCARPWLPLLPT